MFVCCGIQPLAHSSANNNLSTDYTVNVQSNTQARAQVCARETQPSAIIGTSIGATCNDPLTASYYSCPTLCDVFIDTAQDLATLGDLCAAHLPCTNSALTSAEEATCCVERLLPKLAEENMPGANLACGLFVSVVVLLLWTAFYHKKQLKNAQRINRNAVTVGDYAVLVQGLGVNQLTRRQVAEFMSHYGEVASVSFTKNVGNLLKAEQDLSEARMKLAELKAWNEHGKGGGDGGGRPGASFRAMFLGTTEYSDDAVAKAEAKCVRLKESVDQLARLPVVNNGEAFVTMNYEAHANNAFIDHRRGWGELALDYLFGCCGVVWGAPRLNGRRLTMSVPPEPDDVNWENVNIRGQAWYERSVKAWLVLGAGLGIGAGIQIVFEQLREAARASVMDEEIRAAALGENPSGDDGSIGALTAFSGFMIVAINVSLQYLSKVLTKFQRFHTRTNFEASLTLKIFIVTVVNTAIVPITASRCDRTKSTQGECLWYAPGGLIESAFYLQLFNAFLPDLIAYLDFAGKSRQSMAKHAKTQDMAERALEPTEFILAEKYAATLKTVALAVIYGPVLPISYLIAFFGLCVTYCTDKYIALRRARKPVRMKTMHSLYVVMSMRVLAFTQLFIAFDLWFGEEKKAANWFVGGLIIWILWILFLPLIKACIGIERDEAFEDGGTGGVSYHTNMGKGAGANAAPPLPPRPEEDGESELSKQEKLIKCDLLGIKLEDFDKGRLDMYHPPLPADASEGTIKNLVAEYRLFDEPTKGDQTLMRGQKPRTGGFNVNPPGSMPRPQINMFSWMGFGGGGGGGGGSGWFTPAQQGQPTHQTRLQPGTAPVTGYGPPPAGAVRMMPPPGAPPAGAVQMMPPPGAPPGARVVYVQPPPGAPAPIQGQYPAPPGAPPPAGYPAPPPRPAQAGMFAAPGQVMVQAAQRRMPAMFGTGQPTIQQHPPR